MKFWSCRCWHGANWLIAAIGQEFTAMLQNGEKVTGTLTGVHLKNQSVHPTLPEHTKHLNYEVVLGGRAIGAHDIRDIRETRTLGQVWQGPAFTQQKPSVRI